MLFNILETTRPDVPENTLCYLSASVSFDDHQRATVKMQSRKGEFVTDLRTIRIFSYQGPKKANEFIALPLCTQPLPASTFGKWNVRNGPIYSWRLFLPQRHRHEDGAQMIRRGRCGKDESGRGVHLVKEGKKRKRTRCETANQDVSTNMFVIPAGRQKCLDCSSGL